MVVNTKKVSGRRKLHFDSYDDLLAEVDMLASADLETLGNWTLAQILKHLSKAYNGALDGLKFKPPFVMRMMAQMFMKKKFIYGSLPSGFNLPQSARPELTADDDYPLETALQDFRQAVERLKTDTSRVDHPILGKLTTEEWDQFNLRHAEMHLSFVRPKA